MPLFETTLNTVGQDWIKGGAIIVGNVSYANYRTDGTNDEVQLQLAVNEANANVALGRSSEIRVVTDTTYDFNPAYDAVIGGNTRKLAVRLLDNVTIIFNPNVKVNFKSGGNSGGTPTSLFGNFGNLTGAKVICLGDNCFDGGSTTSGTATNRGSAIWLDARSNGCTVLKDCYFQITGTRTAGHLVRLYNSNTSNVSVARNIYTKISQATALHSAYIAERNGEAINCDIDNVSSTFSDGVEYKDGVENSVVNISRLTLAGRYGLNINIDPTKSGADQFKFNDLDVRIGNIEGCTDHQIYIAGMDGRLEANCWNGQKSGIHFGDVLNSGTYYYSSKLTLVNCRSMNNNKSGGSWSGISGQTQNIEIVGGQFSDIATSATQFRGIDLSGNRCDKITLTSASAVGNTNSLQIVVKGVNSRVNPETVVGYNPIVIVPDSTTYVIDGAETQYFLGNNAVLKLPRYSKFLPTVLPRYEVAISGVTAQVEAEQELDLSYKPIDTNTAGTPYVMTLNQSFFFQRFPDQWRIPFNLGTTEAILSNKILGAGTKLNSSADENLSLFDLSRQALSNSHFVYGANSLANPANGGSVLTDWNVEFSNTGTLPTTITHTKNVITAGNNPKSYYSYRIAPNGAGTGFGANDFYAVTQTIYQGTRHLGGLNRKISLGFKANSNLVSKKLGYYIEQHYGTGGSPSATEFINGNNVILTSTDQRVEFTFTLNTLASKTFGTNNDDYIKVWIVYMWGTGTTATRVGSIGVGETFVGAGNIDISAFTLNVGDASLPFQPEQPRRWIAPTFTNSWANTSGFQPAQYSVDKSGFVEIRGLVQSGTVNTPIFTLPHGYRPEFQVYYSPLNFNGSFVPQDAVLVVRANGDVVLEQGNNTQLALDGLRFQVKMN